MKSVKEIFSERLKELLELKDKSQAQLAKELGTTPQAISSYVNGKTTPDYDILCRIADILGVSVDFLLGGESTLSQEEQQLCDELNLNPDSDFLLKTFRRYAAVREKLYNLYYDDHVGLLEDSSLTIQFFHSLNSVLDRFSTICDIFGENDSRHPERVGAFSEEDFTYKLDCLLKNPSFANKDANALIISELIRMNQSQK